MQYKNYLALASLLAFPLAAFFIFFLDINTDLFLTINHSGKALPDILWETLTTFGNKPFTLVLLLLIIWKKPDLLIAALIASVMAGLISSTLKPLFDLARPTDILNISDYHLIGPKISRHSFPSGHTLSAFAIASSLLFFYKKHFLTISMLLLASLVGLSRIMLGVHWPIDVLMGATLGLACGYAGVQFSKLRWIKDYTYKTLIVLVLYLLLAIKLFWKGTTYADVQGLVMVISIAGMALGMFLITNLLVSRISKLNMN